MFKHSGTRVVCWNIILVCIVLTVAETAAVYKNFSATENQPKKKYVSAAGKPFLRPDPVLGYVPSPGNVTTVEYSGDEVSKSLTYTIDENGLRHTPKSLSDTSPAILIFGCSLAFGEGLTDEDTFAYELGRAVRDKYQVYNFAFSGEGPHHMFARISTGRVTQILGLRKPVLAVYLAIPSHIRRASGEYSWTTSHPCYQLQDGKLCFRGSFEKVRSQQAELRRFQTVVNQLNKSHLYCLIADSWARRQARNLTDGQVALFTELVRQSQTLLRQQWPEFELLVLFDDEPNEDSARQITALEQAGIRTLKISREIPELFEKRENYTLSKQDLHFNPAGNRLIAEYLAGGIASQKLLRSARDTASGNH